MSLRKRRDGSTTLISLPDQRFGELSFREVDGHPVLSALNLAPGRGVEVSVGTPGHPAEVLNAIPVTVGSSVPGPVHVPYPYSGFIVPDANGNMPHLDRMGFLVSQWTPWGEYNTQEVWANATPSQ